MSGRAEGNEVLVPFRRWYAEPGVPITEKRTARRCVQVPWTGIAAVKKQADALHRTKQFNNLNSKLLPGDKRP